MTPSLPDARARVERLRDQKQADADYSAQQFQPLARANFQEEADALTVVLAELDRLPRIPTLEQVRSIEWIAGVEGDQCPACTHARERGWHATDCWIARLTASLETP